MRQNKKHSLVFKILKGVCNIAVEIVVAGLSAESNIKKRTFLDWAKLDPSLLDPRSPRNRS